MIVKDNERMPTHRIVSISEYPRSMKRGSAAAYKSCLEDPEINGLLG